MCTAQLTEHLQQCLSENEEEQTNTPPKANDGRSACVFMLIMRSLQSKICSAFVSLCCLSESEGFVCRHFTE